MNLNKALGGFALFVGVWSMLSGLMLPALLCMLMTGVLFACDNER